jgi:monofunctional biosynthetic peptidoglycan transglycosylase
MYFFGKAGYIRKGLEAYFTVLIEIIWGKERIMEVYLNEWEMVCMERKLNTGIERSFWSYATKAAGIAAILPNPRKYAATSSSSYINRRKAKIVASCAP